MMLLEENLIFYIVDILFLVFLNLIFELVVNVKTYLFSVMVSYCYACKY